MQKQAPSPAKLVVMTLFALSCFGLLLFLWNAFGGPTPLQAKGYRFKVAFPEATQLSVQADVRISGVPVGKVTAIDRQTDRTLATIELRPRYAPVSIDARAILRIKTLLGETYIAMTPGSASARKVPENGQLPDARVAPTTELDEVLRAFDTQTRKEFKTWFVGWAAAIRGRGRDVNDVVGNLAPLAENGADLLTILDTQRRSLATLVRDTGTTFGALGRQEAATRSVITAGEQVFAQTARRDQDLQRTFEILPTFLRELRPTLAAVQATSIDAAPVLRDLKPAAPLLRPVLADTIAVAPELQRLFRGLDPIITLSRSALPAATRTLRAAPPLLGVLDPLARELVPVVGYLSQYKLELMQMFMNTSAATQASFQGAGGGAPIHYLRALIPITSEALVQQAKRLPSNRHNPYFAPGAVAGLRQGLEAFDCRNTSNPATLPVLGSAPPCKLQSAPTINGRTLAFPHLDREPAGR